MYLLGKGSCILILLIEEERRNFAIYSLKINNDLGSYYNLINNAILISDAGEAPDGTTTATKMIPGSSGGARGIEEVYTLPSTGEYTTSVYVKAAGHTGWIALYGVDGGTRAYFNPSTGTAGQPGTYPDTPAAGKYGIEDAGNGWYRCHLTVNLTTTGGTEYFYIYFGNSDGSTNVTSSGTNGILMWGLQVELGSFPTSYIPTTNKIAIRGADIVDIDGEDFTDFINPSEGTIIADYKVIAGHPEIMYLSDNTVTKRIGLYEAGSSQTRFIIGNSGTQADTTDSAGTTVGDNIKAAGAYKLNDVAAAKNGVISSTDTNATIPSGLDRAYIGGYFDGSVEGILGLRRLTYYQQRLPNSQLVTLTA